MGNFIGKITGANTVEKYLDKVRRGEASGPLQCSASHRATIAPSSRSQCVRHAVCLSVCLCCTRRGTWLQSRRAAVQQRHQQQVEQAEQQEEQRVERHRAAAVQQAQLSDSSHSRSRVYTCRGLSR